MKDFFLTYKNPLTVVIVLIIMGGLFFYSRMQTSLFPEITFPKIKIIADAGQQPVDKMLLTVTRPLENVIKQVPDLQTIRSTTSRGSCEISAFMNWNGNIDLSQQRIESKINEIRNTLPPDIDIHVEKMNPSILPVIGYSLESKTKSPIELKQLATYIIKPFLSQVNGVSEIRVTGGKEKEYWVILNYSKMNMLGVTPSVISDALSKTNFITSNGYLSDYRMLYLTVTDATVNSKDKLESLIVSNNGKRIIQLKDIAQVQIREAKEYVKINANGKESVLIAVVKQPNSNLLDVSNAMETKITDLKKILPDDVTIQPFYVQADFVNSSVKSVRDSLWIGLVLAIIVAIIFLRSVKASATILITIPVTLSLTIIVLYATGSTFNIMTLGAIAAAIGLIIDDAIVVIEQIHRMHEQHPEERTPELLHKAIRYLFPAMIGSSISTIVIFFPFVLMSGVAGAYFKVMTDTMIITLVCSFFVTWLLLPVIYLFLTRKPNADTTVKKLNKNHSVKNKKWIGYFTERPVIAILIFIFLIVSIIYIIPKLQTGFLPDMDEGSIVLDYSTQPGTSLEETDRILREAEKLIVQVPEVEAYSRRTGTQMGFFITEPNTGDYLIQLKTYRNRTTNEVIDDMRQKIESTQPALRIDFGQVIGDMLGDLITSVQPIEIKIFGEDQKTLQELSKQVASVVENVKGTADIFDGIIIAGPSISIQPYFDKLAQYGITPDNLQFQLQTSLEGNEAGNIYEGQKLPVIRLVYPHNQNLSVDDLNRLQIFLPDGKLIAVNQLASIKINAGDAEIVRENLQNMGVVSGRLDNRDLGSVMKDIQKEVSKSVKLPAGYSIVYGGAYKDQQQSFRELLIILITACLLVFGTMLFLFKEFKAAIFILLIAVSGIAGSYILLFITNTPLNVGSYTGLIMIVGIIAENAIFTFVQFKENMKNISHQKEAHNVKEAIISAVSIRLRPNLMTALGAIFALMPLALGIGNGAQLHRPLAIAVIGGFIIAIPLLLIVLPAAMYMLYKNINTSQNA